MEDFPRIKRLPPYVFNIVNDLKARARKAGEDIIDFGMGNPDGATPKHIVDKLIEAASREDTHRYSVSRGIPRLRRAICHWYKTRYDVDLDMDSEAIVTIGSKEGLSHLGARHGGQGRRGAGAEPELSNSHLRLRHRRRRHPPRTAGAGRRFLRRAREGD